MRSTDTREGDGSGAPTAGGRPDRRRQIIDVAASLFDSHGYNSTSMDALAEAVGIAKPTLYHYFRSKDQLLHRIHHEFISLLMERQQERERAGGDPAEQLRSIMRDIMRLMETHRGHVRVFFEHHRELPPDLRAVVASQRDAYQASVERVITRGVASGVFRPLDARLTTLALFGMCNWSYQWYQRGGPLPAEGIADEFVNLLLNGIGPH
jgi:AcrR family transcriptional regulator